jgi:hypothetical protein
MSDPVDKNQLGTGDEPNLVDKDTKTNDLDPDSLKQDETVSYKSHQKLLNQYKSTQSRLKELEAKEQEREESEQLKRGEYEKVMQLKEEKIKTLQTTIEQKQQEELEGKKLMAFMDKLGGKISDNDYLSLIDIDSIAVDPDTGELDQLSLEKEVDRFSKKHWRVIENQKPKAPTSVGHLGGRPNAKRSLKEMTREELRANYIKGNFS